MKNRILSLFTLLFFALQTGLLPFLPVTEAHASGLWMSADLDGDGLPNTVEGSGWCNAVGCFQTDPLDPDSDDDGLTDGEEKLFDSHPKNNASPGIYVLYDNAFQTEQYYPWQPYGHKMIARGDSFDPPRPDDFDVKKGYPTNLDAVVVRRGDSFYVGGPVGATLTYTKDDASLDDLTVTPDPFSGRWRVTAPSKSGGTVGKYTLDLAGKTLDMFVIFEVPTASGELTNGGIDKFLYDGNSNNMSDERAIVLGDSYYDASHPGPTYAIPSGEYIAEGFGYGFRTQQFNRFLLEEYVMGAINGKTSPKSAANALTNEVDALTIFRNPRVLLDSFSTINPPEGNPRNQCSNVAGLLTAVNRAAGIPARPVMVDWWKSASFDHSTEIWLNNEWRVYRGYRVYEMVEKPDEPDPDPQTPRYLGECEDNYSLWPACGNNQDNSRSSWGANHYKPWHSGGRSSGSVIVQADENWTYTSGVAYRWASWDLDRILLDGNRLVTRNAAYWPTWGWTQEPLDYSGYPGSNWPDGPPPPAPAGISAVGGDQQVTVSWNPVSGATSYNIYYRVGSNPDKKYYDVLTKTVTSPYVVTPLTNGTTYYFGVTAEDSNGESSISTRVSATPQAPPPGAPTGVNANAGIEEVGVTWNPVAGATSYNLYYEVGSTVVTSTATLVAGVTSPYTVTLLTGGTEYAFALIAVGPGGDSPLSAVDTATPRAAGAPTGVNATAGIEEVDVTWAPVAGATSYNLYYEVGSTVHMTATKIAGVTSPYTVAPLTGGTEYAFALTTAAPGGESGLSGVDTATPLTGGSGLVAAGLPSAGFSGAESVSLSSGFEIGRVVSERTLDTDGDGRYDQLVLELEVTVPQAGSYWLRGRLRPVQPAPSLFATGGVIDESLLNPDLVAGTQTVSLIFGGTVIASNRVSGPYTLTGVRLMQVEEPSPTAFMNDSLAYSDNVYTTQPHQFDDFDTVGGALLSNNYSHYDADTDGNGRPDALVVTTGINVYQPSAGYRVEGTLYNSRDEFIGQATWTGSGTDVVLQFDNVTGAGPYSLRSLELFNAEGESIDYIYDAYTIELIPALLNTTSASFDIYPAVDGLGAMGTTITPTQNIATSVVEDNLQLDAEVEVSEAGNYKLEAWLVDANDNLITWASSSSTNLAVGVQTLSLTFDGSIIKSHGVDGPYRVVALKVLDGDATYEVLDTVNVAFTTPAYSLDQFAATGAIFEDSMEQGSAKWVAGGDWNIVLGMHQYFSPSNAWHSDNGGNILKLASPLDLSDMSMVALKFHTGCNFGTGEQGYVEVSLDNNNWDTVATLSGNGTWSDQVQVVDLSDYEDEPAVYIRFRLDSAGGEWYIDNVMISGSGGGSVYLPIIIR